MCQKYVFNIKHKLFNDTKHELPPPPLGGVAGAYLKS